MIDRRTALKTLGASVGVGALAGCTAGETLTNRTVDFAAQPASPLGVQMDQRELIEAVENPSWGPPSAAAVRATKPITIGGVERVLDVGSWGWTSEIYVGGDFRNPAGELVTFATPEVRPLPGMSDQNPLADVSPRDVVGNLGSTTAGSSDATAFVAERDVAVEDDREFDREFVAAGYTGLIERLTDVELEQAGGGVRGTATATIDSPGGSPTSVDVSIAASKLMDAGDHLFVVGCYPVARAGELAGLDETLDQLYDSDNIGVTDDEDDAVRENAALLYHPQADGCGTEGGCKPLAADLIYKSRVQHLRRIPPHVETLSRETRELLTQAVDPYTPPDRGAATLSIVREVQDAIEEVKALARDIEGDLGERLRQRAELRTWSTEDAIRAVERGDWETARGSLEEVRGIVKEDIGTLERDCQSAVCKNALEVEERILGQTATALDSIDGDDGTDGPCLVCSVLSDTRGDVQTIEALNTEVGELLVDWRAKVTQGEIEQARDVASDIIGRGKTIHEIAGRSQERIAGVRVQSRESGGAFSENLGRSQENLGEIKLLAEKDYNSSISNTSASVA